MTKSRSREKVDSLVTQLSGLPATSYDQRIIGSVNGKTPNPLEQWNPKYCGDIDIKIASDGRWFHDGVLMKRMELVKLFAGILRKESDGEYYLVTPVEKCRITVEHHPFVVIDAEYEVVTDNQRAVLWLTLNTDGLIPVGSDYPIACDSRANGAAFVSLVRGLSGLFSRAAWYRLVEMTDETGLITSGDWSVSLLTD